MTVYENGQAAKNASFLLSLKTNEEINSLLSDIAKNIVDSTDEILSENEKDIKNAKDGGMNEIMLDRLSLSKERIKGISEGILQVCSLETPIGKTELMTIRPNGLEVYKKTVPIGVIGMIFESRPNVTVDAAVLALKTGNAIILRGGKEAYLTNRKLTDIMQNSLENAGFDRFSVQLVEDTSRKSALELMTLKEFVDVLIPRGGKGLISSCVENATVETIETGVGNCHVFVDESADFEMAKNIIVNAKTSRPSVCNAEESLLVHESIAKDFLPFIKNELTKKGVTLYGCEKTSKIIDCEKATEEDFYKEYLDLALSVKVVSSVKDAVLHINKYGTHHSDAIVTENKQNADYFLATVDSTSVYHNASTRFTDGFEFGFGAEIGISTQKLHVRGPMGLSALTTYKYVISGNGQVR